MTQGLKPHHHQYFEDRVAYHNDYERGCRVKKVFYLCMICGRQHVEKYELALLKNKKKPLTALEKAKKRYRDGD